MNFSALPAGGNRRRWRKNWRAGCLAGFFVLASAQAGPPHSDLFRREYQPDNVFTYPPKLSLDFRRVAVLPLTPGRVGNDLPEGCAAMAPVLLEQLIKAKRFEVVPVDADVLRRGTGQSSWTGAEVLPADFLGFLRREYGCDGVLFGELTLYRAYAPLAVGWRLKLVDVRSGQIIWATDEVFDDTSPAIHRAAQHFETQRVLWHFGQDQNWLAVNSPRQFGRYSLGTLLGTLPGR